MAFNYGPSRYKANQLLSSLIACGGAQFMSFAAGLWWLSIAAFVPMIAIYRKPELSAWKAELKNAIIAFQIINITASVFFYFFVNSKPGIIFAWLVFSSIFPLRTILKTNGKINAERKKLTGSIW